MPSAETVVVTGASAGIGRAVVEEFALRKARIGLIAREKDRLEKTARAVELLGGKALVLPCDVSDAGQVENAARAAEERLGPIDVWVNNAMVTVFSPFTEVTPEEFKRVTEVTYLGYVYGTMSALRRMVPRNRGTIVQVGSTLAYRAIPLQSAYCGAKHAIRGFTDSIRSELYHQRCRVHLTMVQLPALNTPQFAWSRSKMPRKAQPVPPIYQPELAARAVYWSAHHRQRELSVGSMTSLFILLNKFLPGMGDRYLGMTGYSSQQTGELEDPGRPDNLFDPVPADFGAHGNFDSRSVEDGTQLWSATHPGLSLLALAGAWGLGRNLLRAVKGAPWRQRSATTRS